MTSGESDITYNRKIHSNASESQVCTHGHNRCNEIVQHLNSLRRCRTMEANCRQMHINGQQGIAMKTARCDNMSLMSREIVKYTDAHTDIHMARQIIQGASLDRQSGTHS